MNAQIVYLASAFYVVAVVALVPAVAFLLYDSTRRIRSRFFKRPVASLSVPNPDGILLILDGFTRGIAAAAKVGSFVSTMVANLLAGLALSAVLVATLLYFTARGLLAEQNWARYVAGLLMANLFLLSILSIVSVGSKRVWRALVSVLVAAASFVALRALWHGYHG